MQQALLGDNAAGLWQELSTAWSSAHCVGVEHRAQPGEEPAEMQDTDLLANVCYCATTGGLTLTLALTLALTLTLTVHPNLAGFTVNVFSWEQATGCLDNPKWSFTQMIVLILCVLQLFGLW